MVVAISSTAQTTITMASATAYRVNLLRIEKASRAPLLIGDRVDTRTFECACDHVIFRRIRQLDPEALRDIADRDIADERGVPELLGEAVVGLLLGFIEDVLDQGLELVELGADIRLLDPSVTAVGNLTRDSWCT